MLKLLELPQGNHLMISSLKIHRILELKVYQSLFASDLTCKKGSLIPDTSCSGEYPDMIRFFRIRTNWGTSCEEESCPVRVLFLPPASFEVQAEEQILYLKASQSMNSSTRFNLHT